MRRNFSTWREYRVHYQRPDGSIYIGDWHSGTYCKELVKKRGFAHNFLMVEISNYRILFWEVRDARA